VQWLGPGPYSANMRRHITVGPVLVQHLARECQPTWALKWAIGLRQAWRQPSRRRRLRLFCMGVEGWLRQSVCAERDNFCSDIVFVPTLWYRKSECHFFLFQDKPLRQLSMNILSAETLHLWLYTIRNNKSWWMAEVTTSPLSIILVRDHASSKNKWRKYNSTIGFFLTSRQK
jgi:hypothetical protein